MSKLPFRSRTSDRLRVSLSFNAPSRTQQCFKDECNVNNILARWKKTGLISHVNQFQGDYLNLGDGLTFESAMQHIIAAQDAFDTLPSNIRDRFQNNPAAFLDFVSDNRNSDEMIRMGLAKPPAPGPESSTPPKASKKASGDVSDPSPDAS